MRSREQSLLPHRLQPQRPTAHSTMRSPLANNSNSNDPSSQRIGLRPSPCLPGGWETGLGQLLAGSHRSRRWRPRTRVRQRSGPQTAEGR